jgi:hypothetical protein
VKIDQARRASELTDRAEWNIVGFCSGMPIGHSYFIAMSRIGRNTPCPCGSGKKYKHCCEKLTAGTSQAAGPTPEAIAQMNVQFARHEAREHQRRMLQGLGRPIITFENNGYRVVAVGKQIRWSKAWKTFPDFLFDYIKYVLTPEWGNAELKKPVAGARRSRATL